MMEAHATALPKHCSKSSWVSLTVRVTFLLPALFSSPAKSRPRPWSWTSVHAVQVFVKSKLGGGFAARPAGSEVKYYAETGMLAQLHYTWRDAEISGVILRVMDAHIGITAQDIKWWGYCGCGVMAGKCIGSKAGGSIMTTDGRNSVGG